MKIEQKIVSASVTMEPKKAEPTLERPTILHGVTYKLKPPEHVFPYAIYVTINDWEIDGVTRPFEVFLNSKDTQNLQWVVAVTRLTSMNFRNGVDPALIVDELSSVFDPNGGWWEKGKYVKSIVAAIGGIIGEHLEGIGISTKPEPDKHTKEYIQTKIEETGEEEEALFENAADCPKCGGRMIRLDGCLTCVDCGEGKCG